jgi:8-oxo-dGTP pyrophosphatase MutT (NUDIX family)
MGYLRHLQRCNNFDPGLYTPFFLDGKQVGWIGDGFRERLRQEPVFAVGDDEITLVPELQHFQQRSQALAAVVEKLHREGRINAILDEPYAVTAGPRDEALCLVDRAAAVLFGLRTFGQHVNGFVRSGDAVKMWVGKRARDRFLFPGKLDQLVAGGLPWGVTLEDNLRKECYEEAGIPPEIAMQAAPVGVVSYQVSSARGGKQDLLYCYDLELPADFRPRCTDGEVEEFYLLPLDEIAALVRESDDFKLNCNLVVIDFLIRHGWLQPTEPDYVELATGLSSPATTARNVK